MTTLLDSFRVGRLTVSMASDGTASAPRGPSWFTGIDPADWMPAVGVETPDAPLPVNFGAFVITGDDHVTLVDCGFGEMGLANKAMIGAGGTLDRLRELGIEPGDVDRIIQTHLHADHCGWLIGVDGDDSLTFPNATVYCSTAEVDYWESPAADKNLAPGYTRARLAAVRAAGKLETFDGALQLSDEIEILPTPGHTPGHVSVKVASEDSTVLLLGDVAHHCVHLEKHGWLQNFDVDPATSTATRGRIVGLAADEKMMVTAPHMPILTLVTMHRTDDGFAYQPCEVPR